MSGKEKRKRAKCGGYNHPLNYPRFLPDLEDAMDEYVDVKYGWNLFCSETMMDRWMGDE
jgi:hypothetical protein